MNFPIELIENTDTPVYCYDTALLERTLTAIKAASDYPGYIVHYAIKANHNPEILKIVSRHLQGADVVSGGEIRAALEAGFKPERIMFAGVGKTDAEIRFALESGIGILNVESEPELDVIEEIASANGIVAPVALRINPDVEAHTHHYITTGLPENKFGIDKSRVLDVAKRCAASEHLDFKGLHFHIGSQITDFAPYAILCDRINAILDLLESEGIRAKSVNVGGGIGIDYDNPDENSISDFKKFFDTIHANLRQRDGQEVHFELGRSVVGQCGWLITRVLYVKSTANKRFAIVDAGMTDLIRPALYQAVHRIENLTSQSERTEVYDVVGPVCESTDTFGEDVPMRETRRGDIVAIKSAGAYGEAMAMTYNCRKLPRSLFF